MTPGATPLLDSIGNYVRLMAESPPLGSGPDSDLWKTGRVVLAIEHVIAYLFQRMRFESTLDRASI